MHIHVTCILCKNIFDLKAVNADNSHADTSVVKTFVFKCTQLDDYCVVCVEIIIIIIMKAMIELFKRYITRSRTKNRNIQCKLLRSRCIVIAINDSYCHQLLQNLQSLTFEKKNIHVIFGKNRVPGLIATTKFWSVHKIILIFVLKCG